MSQIEKLMRYQVGQVVQARAAELDEGKTSPPPRYTQSSLINDMENASKFIKDSSERDMIRADGIGTARTREPTLTALIKRGLLETKKSGKQYLVISSQTARNMVGQLPAYLKEVSTTAKWEMMLRAIETGKVDPEKVLNVQKKQIAQIIERAKGQVPGKAP